MVKEEFQISFNTPGFVGDAEQQSAWRTPPFKALLQQWWRVAVAKQHGYDWKKVRETEGRLFGHAWLKDSKGQAWAMRSRVRMKLNHYRRGSLADWTGHDPRVTHLGSQLYLGYGPRKEQNQPELWSSQLYLGYGPLVTRGLKNSPAINAAEHNQLTLIYPEIEHVSLTHALQLMHWLGAVGGRCRNGWGSIDLQGENVQQAFDVTVLQTFGRPFEKCLELEWPHAIGTDEDGLLLWQTPERNGWQQVIKDLAEIKIKFRTGLQFPNGHPGNFEDRHLLAYPVTRHEVNEWRPNDRLSNQLRFKVAKKGSDFVGLIVHLPCGLPMEMAKKLRNPPSIERQKMIWKKVHQSLNDPGISGLEIKRINS